ncbi:MAG: TIGR02996 domain-containing protein [Planctomycetia bacterium]|nr:TIGR02996 domain-containing protein [Planctomycetia bacterium]
MYGAADFMPAILADPDDDVPRLIYADWLEDRGDPYGAFIRVQCELADRNTPFLRREELEQQERALLAAHGAAWAAPLHGWVNHWKYRRGFPDELLLTAKAFVAHAHTVAQVAPASSLRLLFAGPHLRRVLECPALRAVRRLDLSDNYLGVEGARALAEAQHLTALRELDLGLTGMDAAAVEILAQSLILSRVTWLRLAGRAGAPRDLRANNVAFALTGSPHLAQLGTVDLRHCHLTSPGAALLMTSRHLPNLHTLWLEGNYIDDEALLVVARSPQLGRLRVLGLGGNQITDIGIQALVESPHFTQLKRVTVTGNGVSLELLDALRARFGDKVRW